MRGAVNPRRTVRFAAVAAVALLAGLLPGPDSAASGPDGKVTLAYICRFPAAGSAGSTGSGASGTSGTGSGPAASDAPDGGARTLDVTVELVQNYPATAVVGKPIQPGDLTATVTLPRAGAAALLPADAAALTGTASLTAHITQGASTADALWPELTAPSAPAKGDGDLELTFGGAVPPLSVTAAGEVRFAAGELALTLHPATGAASPPPTSPSTTAGTAGTAGTGAQAENTPAASTASTASTASSAASGSTPAPLADIAGACTPAPGQQNVIGAVPVPAPGGSSGTGGSGGAPAPGHGSGGTDSPPAGASGRPGGTAGASGTPGAATTPGAPGARSGHGTITLAAPPHSGVHDCEAPPEGELDPVVIAGHYRPPGTVPYPGPDDPPFPPYSQCGYVTGYSNVLKLHGAAVINDLTKKPSRVTVVQKLTWSKFEPPDDPLQWHFEIDSIAKLELPPSETTFLTYGFVPVSAKMRLIPRGLMTIITDGTSVLGTVTTSTVYGQQDLQLYDVKVNGVPLDVGPHCRASKPLDLKLVGYDRSSLTGRPTGPSDYGVQDGGPLAQDDLFIPAFTGCGSHGENLDPLFTSAISGHGNSLNLIQGPLCVPVSESGCDPEIAFPVPPHH